MAPLHNRVSAFKNARTCHYKASHLCGTFHVEFTRGVSDADT